MSTHLLEQKKFKRLLSLAILIPLALMAALAAVLLWQVSRLLSVTQLVDHTDRVIAEAHETEKLMSNMQTGVRGYLITANPDFLDPYRQALERVEPSLDTLGRLVSDNPSQVRRLEGIRQLYTQWAAIARGLIALKEGGGDYQSAIYEGRDRMARIRSEFAAFIQVEERLRDTQAREARSAARFTLTTVGGLTLLLGGLLAFLTRRQLTAVSRSYGHALTALRERADALRESEERFRALTENSSDGIALLNRDGVVEYASPSTAHLLGCAPQDATGRNAFDLVHRDDRERAVNLFRQVLEGREAPASTECRFRHRDGSWRWLEGTINNLFHVPSVRAVVVNYRDVTGRKRAEEERERFLGVGGEMLFTAGFDGRFRWVSPAWERALGWSSEELTSNPWLHFVHPDDREMTIAEAEMLYSGRETVSFENRYRHKDGSYRWISWKVRPYLDEGLLLGAASDVTEHRLLEEQFRQSQKLESIGQLAGGVAHDFNNLLTIITGYSDLLLGRSRLEEAARSKVEEIRKAAERAAALTRQLLAFSRRQVLQPRTLDLTEVVANMDRMLRRLIGEDVHLATLLEPRLRKVRADPGQIEQVVMNLAVNARDAMPEGGRLTVETKNVYLDDAYARQHAEVTAGTYVMLAVSDTGTGMSAETLEHMFEPFFTTKEQGKGTGLGLATVYGIVKQSGGHIWVYSEIGHGTTFKIYLPAADAGEEVTEQPAPAESARGSETILLVEDEDAVRAMLLDILEPEGYTVLAARGGQEALEVCARHEAPIHLLITDVVMPGLSGRELAARLAERYADLKVLFMSGYTDNAIVHHGVLDPGVNFLQKPFTPDAVLRKVRDVLDGRDSAGEKA